MQPSNTNQNQFCHVCYADNASSMNAVVLDTVVSDGSWICSYCWIQRTQQNPDVQFVLEVLNRFIENTPRDFHHTIGEWSEAVLSIRSLRDMRRFFRGYTYWRIGPEVPPDLAEREAKDNIGCPLNDAGWWARLKWRWACGITKCNTFHY